MTTTKLIANVGVMWRAPTPEQVADDNFGMGAPGIVWAKEYDEVADATNPYIMCVTCSGLGNEAQALRLAKWIMAQGPSIEVEEEQQS